MFHLLSLTFIVSILLVFSFFDAFYARKKFEENGARVLYEIVNDLNNAILCANISTPNKLDTERKKTSKQWLCDTEKAIQNIDFFKINIYLFDQINKNSKKVHITEYDINFPTFLVDYTFYIVNTNKTMIHSIHTFFQNIVTSERGVTYIYKKTIAQNIFVVSVLPEKFSMMKKIIAKKQLYIFLFLFLMLSYIFLCKIVMKNHKNKDEKLSYLVEYNNKFLINSNYIESIKQYLVSLTKIINSLSCLAVESRDIVAKNKLLQSINKFSFLQELNLLASDASQINLNKIILNAISIIQLNKNNNLLFHYHEKEDAYIKNIEFLVQSILLDILNRSIQVCSPIDSIYISLEKEETEYYIKIIDKGFIDITQDESSSADFCALGNVFELSRLINIRIENNFKKHDGNEIKIFIGSYHEHNQNNKESPTSNVYNLFN